MFQLRENPEVVRCPVRLLLVEDSPIIRDSIAEVLSGDCSVVIDAWAATQEAAIELLRLQRFDLLMVDIELAHGNGLEVLKSLLASDYPYPRPVCVVLSNHAYPQYRQAAWALGARYFFDKSLDFDRAIETIEAEAMRLAVVR